MKILHLIDDEKFTDFIISENLKVCTINNVKLQHIFLGLGNNYKFTKKHKESLNLLKDYNKYKSYIGDNKFDILVIHCLTQYKVFALQNSLTNFKKIVWCMWGVDFYTLPWLEFNAYYPLTLSHLQTNTISEKFKHIIRPIYHLMKYGNTLKNAQKKIIKNVDWFSPIVYPEYNIATKIPFFKAKVINYSYGNLSSIIGNLDITNNKIENNIYIGNSATPESNHFDILHQLNNFNLGNRKIITPLSYGQRDTYGVKVNNFGKELFGDNFIGITDFIPLKEYVNNIKSCGFCIMNHKRQQGLGNALIFLLLGSKLFLSIENPMYAYFSSINVKVFSIERELIQSELDSLLDTDIQLKNREIIMSLFSEQTVNNIYINFYHTIISSL